MPLPRLRIAHVAGTPTGAPWMVSIIREQRRRGHEVFAIISNAIEGGVDTLEPIFREEGIPYRRTALDLTARAGLLRTAKTVREVGRLLRELQVDVAQYHLFPSIITGRLAAWAADVPLRFSMIPGTLYLEAPILGEMESGTAWADTKVIATCNRTRELYGEHGIPLEKVDVIYYGLDGAQFDPAGADGARVRRDLGLRDDQPVVGMVAYFYPPMRNAHLSPAHLVGKGLKGHEIVLAAIPRVVAEFPNAKFVFVGRGWYADGEAYYETVRQLAREMNLMDHVIFAGERSDVPSVLASFDVAMQPSLCENLGGSIEALTMQRPLIASRVGGLVDSVLHEKTGLLVDPENAEQLADAIVRLLSDRELAARLAAQGRAYMLEKFTLQKTVDDLDALYERELARGGFDPRRPLHTQRYRRAVALFRFAQLPMRTARLLTLIESMRFKVKGRTVLERVRGRIPRPRLPVLRIPLPRLSVPRFSRPRMPLALIHLGLHAASWRMRFVCFLHRTRARLVGALPTPVRRAIRNVIRGGTA